MSLTHHALLSTCAMQNHEKLLNSQPYPVAFCCHHCGTSSPLFWAVVDHSHCSDEP